MRSALIVSACFALLLVCVGADNAARTLPAGGAQAYLPAAPAELVAHGGQFVGQSLQVKDAFLTFVAWADVPGAAAAYGVQPATHIVFRTSPAGGSDMLCFVPNTDAASIGVLNTLVQGSQITLLGMVKGRAGVGLIFIVDKMFRGHGEIPAEQARTVVLTLKSVQTGKTVTYTIPEMNKEYVIKLPDTLQDLNAALAGAAAPATAAPTDVKIIVKANLKQ